MRILIIEDEHTLTRNIQKFLLLENLPGKFPFTAGVFPFKRTEEEPKRMFAGEGPPEKTTPVSAEVPAILPPWSQ